MVAQHKTSALLFPTPFQHVPVVDASNALELRRIVRTSRCFVQGMGASGLSMGSGGMGGAGRGTVDPATQAKLGLKDSSDPFSFI